MAAAKKTATPAAAKATQGPIVSVTLVLARETKNTVRYEGDDDSPISILYIEKVAFADGQYPNAIVVTVTAG